MKRVGVFVLALTLVTTVAFAQEPKCKAQPCDMSMKKGPIFGDVQRLKQELGLSDAQVDKIVEINTQYEKRMLDIKEKLAPKMVQLKKLLLEDEVDINAVRAKLKEIGDLRIELHLLRIQHVMDIEKQLNKEQLKKLRAHKKMEMQKMEKMRPHGPMGFDEPMM
ncbi:MAG: periplasmic heavy metal sensor [Spirochaetes bacterium]|nr:periplasmic heavy metal sensor [Spirochaetota bacterium]